MSLVDIALPDGLVLTRTTPTFTTDTVPAGLLRDHKIAAGVWGRLHVVAGTVTFVSDETGETRDLSAGDAQVIEPDALHHVVVGDDARFYVEFHR